MYDALSDISRYEYNREIKMIEDQLEFTVRVAQEWQVRAEAAERRVAELEAAQAWRPVTEPPRENGDYLVYCWPGECEVMSIWDGHWARIGIPVYYWQPLPAPPIDPPAPA